MNNVQKELTQLANQMTGGDRSLSEIYTELCQCAGDMAGSYIQETHPTHIRERLLISVVGVAVALLQYCELLNLDLQLERPGTQELDWAMEDSLDTEIRLQKVKTQVLNFFCCTGFFLHNSMEDLTDITTHEKAVRELFKSLDKISSEFNSSIYQMLVEFNNGFLP